MNSIWTKHLIGEAVQIHAALAISLVMQILSPINDVNLNLQGLLWDCYIYKERATATEVSTHIIIKFTSEKSIWRNLVEFHANFESAKFFVKSQLHEILGKENLDSFLV